MTLGQQDDDYTILVVIETEISSNAGDHGRTNVQPSLNNGSTKISTAVDTKREKGKPSPCGSPTALSARFRSAPATIKVVSARYGVSVVCVNPFILYHPLPPFAHTRIYTCPHASITGREALPVTVTVTA